MRYAGTDTPLTIAYGEDEPMRSAFAEAHRDRFGFLLDKPLIVESASVEAIAAMESEVATPRAQADATAAPPVSRQRVRLAGAAHEAPCYLRAQLGSGQVIDGPAIIADAHSTTVVEPGWRAEITARNDLMLVRRSGAARPRADTRADPIRLEVFNNLFMHIAEQMGTLLESTAQSVNIKERLDSPALSSTSRDA